MKSDDKYSLADSKLKCLNFQQLKSFKKKTENERWRTEFLLICFGRFGIITKVYYQWIKQF